MRRRASTLLALLAAVALAAPARAGGEEDLPARQRALLLLRVLAYDRNLKARAGEAVSVAVLYRKGEARSEACNGELMTTLIEVASVSIVAGMPIRPRSVSWTSGPALDAELVRARVAALFVCPGLEEAIPSIREASRRRSVFTAASGRPLVEAGLSLGLVNRGARAGLIVNLEAARAEGADLDSALLRLAEVLREPPPPDNAEVRP